MEALSSPKTTPEDRRCLSDRRFSGTSLLLPVFRPYRRSIFRRRGEFENQYVDNLQLKVVIWALSLMVFCAFDAGLTIIHIEHGGQELVPTMKWALSLSYEAFLYIKLGLTSMGAIFLAGHYNFNVGRICIRFVFFVYFFLMIYHIILVLMRNSV